MPSVVIAAHNEERVIKTTLDAVLAAKVEGTREVIVSANGCTDATASVARRPGVVVIDRPQPGKASALNAGDQAAKEFPRIYLDADIIVPPGGLATLLAKLDSARALAAVPCREVNTKGRPWPVRAYSAISERLPAFRNGLFGRGMIALSEEGRARFSTFPEMIADDLFLDSLFSESEKLHVPDVVITVEAPYTSRDLLRRLVRVRRGNREMRAAGGAGVLTIDVRRAERWAWLRDVVLREPRLAPAALPYLSFTVLAALLARRKREAARAWQRDESTRNRASSGGAVET